MRTKKLFFSLFILFISAKGFSQASNDSTAVSKIDPTKKERSDDPTIQWRSISKKDLLAVKHIEELLTDAPKEKFQIVSFNITFDGDNTPYFEYPAKGNVFSEAVLGNIEKSPAGTKIMIEFIKATMADGKFRLLNPVNLLITD